MTKVRIGLLSLAVTCWLGAGVAWARPLPGADPSISDTAESTAQVAGDLGPHDTAPADPVILEPIRPLFPGDVTADSPVFRPAGCGAMNDSTSGVMFAGLLLLGMGGTTRRHG